MSMNFNCEAEFVGRREVNGPLSVKTISECVRVVFVSALEKGSTTSTRKLPVSKIEFGLNGVFASGIVETTMENVIFCHIDQKHRNLFVLVVRLKESESDSTESRLDALIWKCASVDDTNNVFQKFHEIRQSQKMSRHKRSEVKSKDFSKNSEAVDSSSVSSDSAIESGSCPSSSTSPNVSSDECSDSITSETLSVEQKLQSLDLEEPSSMNSQGVEPAPKKISAKRRAPNPPSRQMKSRSKSVPAAKILMELIDKDGIEHKEVVSSLDAKTSPKHQGTVDVDAVLARQSRSRQRQPETVDSKRVEHRPSCTEVSIGNILRKIKPREVKRDGSTGIVSFSAGENHSALNPTSSSLAKMTLYPTRSTFDPKTLTKAQILQRPMLYRPAGNLNYKQWRVATGLDQSRSSKSPLQRVGLILADSKQSFINALRRPLNVKRSDSVTSRRSSEPCTDVKLRSVMKKGHNRSSSYIEGSQFGAIVGHQDKKNVTFNALTRVQVVDCL